MRSAVFAAMSKHDAVPETTVMKSDVQALVPLGGAQGPVKGVVVFCVFSIGS